ncbi:VOC family protein [Tepidiforma sp.]|uniref:VOC family protein n=1 Tax=Tepidiforma sp. TaxID=2682230 RepID=UPI0021DC722C|nr:VOC family protein [Tepidiforma sp.]MCX7617680.1 hypothetical protein [Tepidiforma sp.]GIW17814.1 MAG: hypothetical protein KatS3mg064_0971 [Tepidiforma sp.]
MATTLAHLQVNIDPAHAGFYRELFTHLGWGVLYDGDGILGVGATNDASLWFVPRTAEGPNDYDRAGVNHIAIGADSIAEVDAAAAYLASRGVPALFETPRHRPEFADGSGQTYYQVMFESPDRVLFEVVYSGPLET